MIRNLLLPNLSDDIIHADFGWPGITLSLIAGVLIGYEVGLWQCRRADRLDPEHAPHWRQANAPQVWKRIGAGVLVLLSVYFTITISANSERDKEQARTQAECNAGMYDTVNKRGAATVSDIDALLEAVRANQVLFRAIVEPPPPNQDRSAYFSRLITEAADTLQRSEEAIQANKKTRADNPYPEPNCAFEVR